jgi:hypothetical protein
VIDNLLFLYDVMGLCFFGGLVDQEVCPYQKPLSLWMRIFECHMNVSPQSGPATGSDEIPQVDPSTGNHDVPLAKTWVLDAGCGTASCSHAALLCGHNAFAFDWDEHMVSAARSRLISFEEHPDHNGELTTQTEKRREFAVEKRDETAVVRQVTTDEKLAARQAAAVCKEAKKEAELAAKEAKKEAELAAKEAKKEEKEAGKQEKKAEKQEKAAEKKAEKQAEKESKTREAAPKRKRNAGS